MRRGLVGEIVGRLERKGLAIDAMRLRTMDRALADQHYAEHVERDFYPPLRDFMTGGTWSRWSSPATRRSPSSAP